MKQSLIIAVCFLGLVSCTNDPDPTPAAPTHEALSVLDEELYTPKGKIKASRTNHLTPLTGYTYRYYDARGNNVLRVRMSPEDKDTLSISIFKFDEKDRAIENLFFTYEAGVFEWTTSLTSIFSDDGLREDVYKASVDAKEAYRYSYIYNADGGKTEWRFGYEENTEKYRYVYENGRISEEHWVLENGEIFEQYHYRYRDDGLLEARETSGTRGKMDDATQYEYNASGQLIEVRNYDQYWGFAYTGMTEYVYY
ncbi:hypothetical protein [Echinicola vietnamensis]|uniref:Uncharacterized protein n=1 Tax=Echinicola vietnamensis (strain DSM 17526 / LMG 23754 / KMM 6221) TaxID=926556 RepID=L0FZF4_ECHVK|nr:hypothetical protein [Echinicola vietnamensis]AGA77995.1 hypothetical protein Echvi_1730 [Echinicola vietnamensis DSM 17526]